MIDKVARAVAKSIRAYHGSPHDFDRFDMSKIGTGEGAQAFGHGLYFAEREGTARSYRDKLQKTMSPHITFEGERMNASLLDRLRRSVDPADLTLSRYGQQLMSRAGKRDPLQRLRDDLAHAESEIARWNARKADHLANPPAQSTYGPRDFDLFAATNEAKARDLRELLPRLAWEKGGPTGKMYEVNIAAEPDQFLRWDVPMGEQPNSVIDAVRPWVSQAQDRSAAARQTRLARGTDAFGRPLDEQEIARLSAPQPAFETLPGHEAYKQAGLPANNAWSGQKLASQRLNAAGVPGVSYLDGASRAAGEGTNNYVVFDDKLVDIARKYALPGAVPAGAAAMGALAAQDTYDGGM